MRIINTSAALAELLPEVYAELDPDGCFDFDAAVPFAVRLYIKNLIMMAFSKKSDFYESDLHQEWFIAIRKDSFLRAVDRFRWVDLDVIDTEGTYVLIIEE